MPTTVDCWRSTLMLRSPLGKHHFEIHHLGLTQQSAQVIDDLFRRADSGSVFYFSKECRIKDDGVLRAQNEFDLIIANRNGLMMLQAVRFAHRDPVHRRGGHQDMEINTILAGAQFCGIIGTSCQP